MCSANFLSLSASGLSTSKKIKSNRERIAFDIFVLSLKDFALLKQPLIGLAEAIILTRHFNWQMTPALAIEIVCCSIASSKEEESLALSN